MALTRVCSPGSWFGINPRRNELVVVPSASLTRVRQEISQG